MRAMEKLLENLELVINFAVGNSNTIEQFALDMLDAAFAPRQILRQLGMIGFLQMFLITWNATHKVFRDCVMILTESGRRERQLQEWLARANNYTEWKEIVSMLDELHGHDEWRKIDSSSLYDHHALKKQIKSTYEMLNRGEVFQLMFRLRGGLYRDQFGVLHDGLYSRARAGTKLIVEKYQETMVAALNLICDSPISDEEIPTDAKLAFFNETRHAFGRTALLLSGGAYLGYYHMGVVKALFAEGLLPRVISGASAGSIMTAIVGTRTDVEVAELFPENPIKPPESIRTDFFRFSHELKSEIGRRLNYLVPQGLRWMTFPILCSVFEKKILNLDTEHFKKALMQNVGLYTFQEAFDRTGRVINITVAPLNNYDPPRLLNYLTAPHVCVWSAVAASCAIPGVFDSISLIVKEPNGQYRPENEWTRQSLTEREERKQAKLAGYSDGSIENDLPMQQLSELFNVNHFIVSQVNPHSAILSAMGMKATVWSNPVYSALVGYLRFLTAQCRDWLKNIVNMLIFRSKAPLWSTRRGFAQALTQEYEGRSGVDVTIMPWQGHISMLTALTIAIKNPTPEELLEVFRVAEANTWPHLVRIRAHCLIEVTLDKCVQKLRKRITDESERQRIMAAKAMLESTTSPSRNIDRTPSFYTSRSIVNLSGLSVSDPLPVSQQAHKKSGCAERGYGHLMPSTSQTKLVDPFVLRSESRDGAEVLDGRGVSLERQRSADSSQRSIQHPSLPSSDSFWNLAVPGADIPLAVAPEATDRTPISTDSSANSLTEEDMKMVASNSRENLRGDIYKTTSMANFYYKNSAPYALFEHVDE